MRRFDLRYENALEDYRAALSIDTQDTAAIRGQAHALVQLGRQREIQPGQWDLSGFETGYGQKLDLAGMNLRGANFSGSQLNGVDFAGANLTNADF